jgi:hypothetical protein
MDVFSVRGRLAGGDDMVAQRRERIDDRLGLKGQSESHLGSLIPSQSHKQKLGA